jgi:hypothetical protein
MVLIGLCLSLWIPTAGAAHDRTGLSVTAPRNYGTMIACFDQRTGNYVDKVKPANCEVAGYEGEHGRRLVKTPVDGIRWEKWGTYNSRGSRGIDVENRARIRLFAYRRIRCSDNRVFYSYANVVNLDTGSYFYVRLPICGDPTPKP